MGNAEDVKNDVLYAKVSHELYMTVYRASQETGFPMTQLIRLCMEMALPSVVKSLMAMREGKLTVAK